MNTPFKKRVNPLAVEDEKPVQPEPKPKPVVEQKVEPAPVRPEPRVEVHQEPKKAVRHDAVKEKYTAVMDRDLRKRVKVASINLGVDYSTFIEEAVMEKLSREGY